MLVWNVWYRTYSITSYRGLSVLLVGGAGFVWGIYGGDISNEFGSAVEEVSFDLYDRLFD
ncbi:hypothetical protein [Aliivibrio salmonicida]|uniref:hypothetical protein n=1 Tax=Aliivibrio salmonicida TaxID=40269 RepID=UPI0013EA871B|nr:hypothetical protein [Aliivibrio salmonicida]